MKIIQTSILSAAIGLLSTTLYGTPARAEATSPEQKTRTHFQSLLKEKPGFYPACNATPLRPRQENFQKKHLTLSGLTGVHLNVDDLLKSASKKEATLAKDLKRQVAQRLAKGGLRLLTKEEMIRTPGQPEMNIYMTFPPHMTPVKKGKKRAAYRPDCCAMSTWAAFSQAAQIMRDPDTNYKLGTWGKGHNTTDCSNPAGWMNKVILETVDNFVADKLKGDKDYAAWLKKRGQPATAKKPNKVKTHKKAGVSKKHQQLKQQVKRELAALGAQSKIGAQGKAQTPAPAQQPIAFTPPPSPPINCNGAIRTYIDMFATNQIHVDSANYYALDLLAASIRSCPMYNYVIETHADPRSSFEHNERLSALRAASLQGHLLARGVDKRQFIIQSFGEINPVSRGTTAMDHAANRRVVVRPYARR